MPIDIASTAHAFSLDIVEEVVRRSPTMESVSFPHPKWLIIAKEMRAKIASVETQNVLTFETPEQHKEGEETDYGLTQQGYMATLGLASTVSVEEWELRFRTQRQYLEFLRGQLALLVEPQRVKEFEDKIDLSLSSSKGRREVIIKTLI